MNGIIIGNVSSKDSPQAAKIYYALNGYTYMNFQVRFVPIGGSFDIWVESEYDCSESEFRDFLLSYMTNQIMGIK